MPQPDRPESYPRRILLAVTGLSPQIVTETLYALAIAHEPAWVPTEVQVLTTARGADNARLNLLSEEPGWFHRLRRDYGLPEIAFGPENIHIMRRPDGSTLEDILDNADNVAVADFITEHLRALTADDNASLHVSIAGGRKTMGFYVGYALSLFGRAQDRLSHVLVSPPFESLHEFFYPTPSMRVIRERPGQALDAKNARVWLGDIPFVRLRDGLPKQLLEGSARFSEAVAEAQKALPPLSLILDPASRAVIAGGESFTLKPAEFAFYLMLAERGRKHQAGAHWSDKALEHEIRQCYARVIKPNSGDFVRFEEHGMSKDNFNARKAHINKALTRALGERRAAPYLISALEPFSDPQKRRCRPYGLLVPAEAIRIDETASLQARQRQEHAR
ncbi:MAG: TIGR02584 family CRISPR-associated protein [Betaproteobacteria bacterium]|nr:TIGR02584 family CRISPR-associated protein [Betaproteobacteria bacterium]